MQLQKPLDREFLPTRAKILEIAAVLDRLDRLSEETATEPRLRLLKQAMQLVLERNENRAEAVQMLFSREYDSDWRSALSLERAPDGDGCS
jgi:hypothetical protein